MEPPQDPPRPMPPRNGLLASLGVVLAGASLVIFGHAVSDGAPSLVRALLLVGLAEDPLASAWLAALAGALVAIGAALRPAYLWVGLAGLGTFGAFFFLTIGWAYLASSLLMAAWASTRPAGAMRPS